MKNMHYKYLLLLATPILLFSCKKETTPYVPPADEPTVSPVLLKDIVIPNLPSPYYHFEYNTEGRASVVSFAAGFNNYAIEYGGSRINAMQNNTVVNKDRLQYVYDNAGRVSMIRYTDSNGMVFRRVFLNYDAVKLTSLEREVASPPGFVVEKTMTFQYYPDGNVREVTETHPAIDGQPALTFTDRYEAYDTAINVTGFNLIHTDFFEHLLLLPGVVFQKNNPGKLVHTGNGINYQLDYTYTYNNKNVPLTRTGKGKWLNGADAGKTFLSNATYSYY